MTNQEALDFVPMARKLWMFLGNRGGIFRNLETGSLKYLSEIDCQKGYTRVCSYYKRSQKSFSGKTDQEVADILLEWSDETES
jgi:hypothetical protein